MSGCLILGFFFFFCRYAVRGDELTPAIRIRISPIISYQSRGQGSGALQSGLAGTLGYPGVESGHVTRFV